MIRRRVQVQVQPIGLYVLVESLVNPSCIKNCYITQCAFSFWFLHRRTLEAKWGRGKMQMPKSWKIETILCLQFRTIFLQPRVAERARAYMNEVWVSFIHVRLLSLFAFFSNFTEFSGPATFFTTFSLIQALVYVILYTSKSLHK